MDVEDVGLMGDPTRDFIAATSKCIKSAQRVRFGGADVPGRIENVVSEHEGELHDAADPFAVHLVASELSLTLGRDSYTADEVATRRAYRSEKFDPIADIMAELGLKSS